MDDVETPKVKKDGFLNHVFNFDTETKTLSTNKGMQFFGSSFFKDSVVMQKDAFVFLATSLYLLE